MYRLTGQIVHVFINHEWSIRRQTLSQNRLSVWNEIRAAFRSSLNYELLSLSQGFILLFIHFMRDRFLPLVTTDTGSLSLVAFPNLITDNNFCHLTRLDILDTFDHFDNFFQ